MCNSISKLDAFQNFFYCIRASIRHIVIIIRPEQPAAIAAGR